MIDWSRCQLLLDACACWRAVGPCPGEARYKSSYTHSVNIYAQFNRPLCPSKVPHLPADLHQIWRGRVGQSADQNDGGCGGLAPIGGTGEAPKVEKSRFLEVFRPWYPSPKFTQKANYTSV